MTSPYLDIPLFPLEHALKAGVRALCATSPEVMLDYPDDAPPRGLSPTGPPPSRIGTGNEPALRSPGVAEAVGNLRPPSGAPGQARRSAVTPRPAIMRLARACGSVMGRLPAHRIDPRPARAAADYLARGTKERLRPARVPR
jgi:hypothetical protein